MHSGEAFSSIDLVGQCLLDEKRTVAFKDAIEHVIKPGMTVLDSGTGSGILAMLAAKAGASKVYAVELDPYIASVTEENIKANNLDDLIEIVRGDMRSIDLPSIDQLDVVIMEMITTGMIDEFQIPAIDHLKRLGVVNKETIFLPMNQQSFVSFGYSDFNLYGLKIPMILHMWNIHTKLQDHMEPMSDTVIYDDYDFACDNRLIVDSEIKVDIKKHGKINCILLESRSIIGPDTSIWETSAINGKVLIPVEEREVEPGHILKGRIKYQYGSGFKSFIFSWQ